MNQPYLEPYTYLEPYIGPDVVPLDVDSFSQWIDMTDICPRCGQQMKEHAIIYSSFIHDSVTVEVTCPTPMELLADVSLEEE